MEFTTFVTLNNFTKNSSDFPPQIIGNFDWVIACYAVLAVVGTIGNLAVVIVVSTSKDLRKKPPYILIISLSISTFYISCFVLPFAVYTMIIKHWPDHLSLEYCRFNAFLTQFYPGVTAFHIMMIAINRYFGTVWFEYYEKLSGKVALAIQIALCYMFSVLLIVVPIAHSHGEFNPQTLRCSAYSHSEVVRRYSSILRYITFFVPITVMVYCFIHISITIRRKKHEVLTCDDDKKKPEEFYRFFNEIKTTKIALCLFATMFLRIPPMFISLAPPTLMFDVRQSTVIIAICSQMCYPFVFIAMSSEFRRAFARLFCCKRDSRKEHLPEEETEMTRI